MKTGTPSRALQDARGRKFALVASRFHEEIVDRLLSGAEALLLAAGASPSDLRIERVPGAWEIPQALELLARQGGFDGFVALGALVRGETAHFDLIAAECARGIADVALRHGVPAAFGVLTCETMEQAWARAGGALGNQGAEAAQAALEMADLAARCRG